MLSKSALGYRDVSHQNIIIDLYNLYDRAGVMCIFWHKTNKITKFSSQMPSYTPPKNSFRVEGGET